MTAPLPLSQSQLFSSRICILICWSPSSSPPSVCTRSQPFRSPSSGLSGGGVSRPGRSRENGLSKAETEKGVVKETWGWGSLLFLLAVSSSLSFLHCTFFYSSSSPLSSFTFFIIIFFFSSFSCSFSSVSSSLSPLSSSSPSLLRPLFIFLLSFQSFSPFLYFFFLFILFLADWEIG